MLAVEKLLNLFIDESVMDVNQCKYKKGSQLSVILF